MSPCYGMHVARPRFILAILSSETVLGNRVRTYVNSMGKIPSTGGSEEGRTPDAAKLIAPGILLGIVMRVPSHQCESAMDLNTRRPALEAGILTTLPQKWF